MPKQNFVFGKSSKPVTGTTPKRSGVIGKVIKTKIHKHAEMTGVMVVDVDEASSIFFELKRGLWEQAQHVRQGLPSEFAVEMSDALEMPRATFLQHLKLARSTIESRIKSKKVLSPTEGDAVLRAAKALTRAQEVFEDNTSAASWLKRPNRSLGGVTPFSLIDTDSGFELVMETLGRIEHGVVA